MEKTLSSRYCGELQWAVWSLLPQEAFVPYLIQASILGDRELLTL